MTYAFTIEPGDKVRLKHYDPDHTAGLKREQAEAEFEALSAEFDTLQEELYAAGTDSVLVILQGMDTAGKDGAIRKVFARANAQGMRVESFKVPTPEDLAHDFLWRIHKVTPARGMITVFNRSHYEDVLVVRVKDLVPKPVWKQRYDQINAFEQLLAQSNTLVLKFFLHISKEEQEQRLIAREQDVEKAWKLSATDWKERAYWDDYMQAYEDALSKCSTKDAPWRLIPANHKWFRDLAIAETLVGELKARRGQWSATLKAMSEARLAELQAFRASAKQ